MSAVKYVKYCTMINIAFVSFSMLDSVSGFTEIFTNRVKTTFLRHNTLVEYMYVTHKSEFENTISRDLYVVKISL